MTDSDDKLNGQCQRKMNENLQNRNVNIVTPANKDSKMVQITASNEEINRRINAFMTRKRQQINEQNVREFCHRDINEENEFSCARVDAEFVRRKDSKSHIKVHSIVNSWGPQTVDTLTLYKKLNIESTGPSLCPLDERMSGIEKKLGMNKPVPKDFYQRLKQIEDRILYLESISPEYKRVLGDRNEESHLDFNQKKTYSSAELDHKLRKLENQYVRKIH